MLPEYYFNLITTLESRHGPFKKLVAQEFIPRFCDHVQHDAAEEDETCDLPEILPMNWYLHLTKKGEERVPFSHHVQHNQQSVATSQPSSGTDHPTKRQLPHELLLRILDFCPDRMTLFQLMHTSSMFRAEVSKIFWADPTTYYTINAAWILKGGHPGSVGYDMAFLLQVQNIEIAYSTNADGLLAPRGESGIKQHLVESFWAVLRQRCPRAKRVMINQTSTRDHLSQQTCLIRLAKACPSEIDLAIFLMGHHYTPRPRRGHLPRRGPVITAAKSLRRLSDKGTLEKITLRPNHTTVSIPLRRFHGPVGEYEKADHINQRIELQRLGLGAAMIEALDRHHFSEGGPGPFYCPMRYCDPRRGELFSQAGEWMLHAAVNHSNDLIPGHSFEAWPQELRRKFKDRQLEMFRVKQKIDAEMKRMQKEWDGADWEARKAIKASWMEQLNNDPDWDTGVPVEESPLWQRFESRMQKW